MSMLENQTAIVTGGTAGIGRAIAEKFVEQGATVILMGTNSERGSQAVGEIQNSYPNAAVSFCQVNVSDHEAVKKAIDEIIKEHPQIDILVNNAGITRDKLMLRMSEQDWDEVMSINAKSCYNMCQALLRPMLKARQGKIINVSSIVGLLGGVGQTNYAASKAAMIGFTKALAKEIASRNICVNCIAPGFIQTRMTEQLPEERKKELIGDTPLGRFGQPQDVANAALFLASSLSDFITGQVLVVDGGMIIQ